MVRGKEERENEERGVLSLVKLLDGLAMAEEEVEIYSGSPGR
jgi:hypothetical protein